MSKKVEKVHGVIGIESRMANWNADFSGYARTTSKGEIFGTDKALKYAIRNFWNDRDEKLLCFKELAEYVPTVKEDTDDGKAKKKKKTEASSALQVMTLDEKFVRDFNIENLKAVPHTDVLANLLTYTDVKNFGVTFATETCNLSVTGIVQIGHGFNVMKGTDNFEIQILSPFRNSNANSTEKATGTIGTQIMTDEAHYLYNFVVNPLAYQKQTKLLKGKIDDSVLNYTEEDYARFKEAALLCATGLNSCSKKGCDNEFALFIETDMDVFLPDLTKYIKFQKAGDKSVYTVNIQSLLNNLGDKIKKVEVFYNENNIELKGDILENSKAKIFNIFNKKEIGC